MSETEYCHVQRSPFCWLLYAIAFGILVASWFTPAPTSYILLGSGVCVAMIAMGFQHLKVQDEGDQLGIRFGPFPLFAKTIRYADITAVEADRTTLMEGWGIHKSFRGGWVWNIWGFDCVKVDHAHVTRIGTDDVDHLIAFLQRRAEIGKS